MKLLQEKIGERATLTGYIHEKSEEMGNIEQFPTVLVLPGGGMRICSDREAEPIAMAYYAEGYSAFVLDYTTTTKKPAAVMAEPMEEVESSMRWIREHADDYALDPKKIVLVGFSGGGHLALATVTHGKEKPNAMILGYPGVVESKVRAINCPDILENIDETMPPMFLFVMRQDPITPPIHVLSLAQKLTECGVDYELHLFKGKTHGASLGTAFTSDGEKANLAPRYAQWLPMSISWLKETLGDFLIYGMDAAQAGHLHVDLSIGEIAESEKGLATLKGWIPGVEKTLQNSIACTMTLRKMGAYIPGFDDEKMQALNDALMQI